MTLPTTTPLGPGILKIGETGTEIDLSCYVNSCTIQADKNQGDSTTKLCGDVKPGAVTYDYHMAGNLDLDLDTGTGFFALSQAQAGQVLSYEFTPHTDTGTKAVGELVVDPLDFGGDATGEAMTSDFDFALIGQPTYTYGTGAAVMASGTDDDEAAA